MPEIEEAGNSVKGGLTHKLGPLPVWAWAGIGVVGVFFILPRLTGSSSSSAPASTTPNASILPDGTTSAQNAETTLSGQLTDLQGQVGHIDQLLTDFSQSPNVPSTQTTPSSAPGISQDVQNIYSDLLGRPVGSADLAGENYWNASGLNQLQLLTHVEATPEAQALAASNPVGYVTGQYQFVGQTPDQGGLAYWESYATQHGSVQEANAFANSVAAQRGQKPVA